MSVFLSSQYTYSPTHLHKEKIKTCHVSGKFLNIYINFLWRNPKWVWTISKNSNTTASNCWKLIILPCWKQASKYPDMKFCTELVSILLKTQGSFSLVTSYLSSKQEMRSFVIMFDTSWKNVATRHHEKQIFDSILGPL